MSSTEILNRANKVIHGERQDMYGKPESNLGFIADLWTIYLAKLITAEDVALMMGLFKIARCKTGVGTEDSFVDACGYLALAGEMASERLDRMSKAMNSFIDHEEDEYDTADHA